MRILSLAVFLGLLALCAAQGRTDGAKTPPKAEGPNQDQAATTQDRLRREFDDLKQSLLRLKQRLENSPRPEDKARAQAIERALQMVARQGTDGKFNTLVQNLKKSDAFSNLETMQQMMNRNQELRDDLRKLIDILAHDNREDQMKKEKEDAQKTLQELKEIIARQERVRASTELGKQGKEDLESAQKKVTNQTKDLAGLPKDKGASKAGSDKDPKEANKGKEGKDDKDAKESDASKKDGKDSKGDPSGKSGDPKKGNSKGGEPKGGEPKSGEPSPSSPNESAEQAAAKKSIKEATQDQEKAQEKIAKGDNKGASNDQTQALDKLKQAQKKLEELLQQIREEEMKKLLAQLQQRCEKMLNMQISVKTSTEELDKAIQSQPGGKPSRSEDQRGLELGDAEDAIVREASAALLLIEQEGSAIAFAEVFGQVRQDMMLVSQKLKKADAAAITQGIETDIIDSLKEMIAALKKARQEPSKQQKPSSGGESSSSNNDQKLIDQIAELKMIRSMQLRVNQRTTTYARQFEGEQPKVVSDLKEREKVDQLKKELFDLGTRQEKITKVTRDMAFGRNKAQ